MLQDGLHWYELHWVGSNAWLCSLKCCDYGKAITTHLSTDCQVNSNQAARPGFALGQPGFDSTWVACFTYSPTFLFCPDITHLIPCPCFWFNHSFLLLWWFCFSVPVYYKNVLNSGLTHCTEPQKFSNKQDLAQPGQSTLGFLI